MGLALLGLALGLATQAGRRHWPTVAVGGVKFVALLSRLVLLALVDATSFPAARYGPYLMPGIDFLVAALVVGSWMLATVVRDEMRRRQALVVEQGRAEGVEPERDADDRLDAPAHTNARLVPE